MKKNLYNFDREGDKWPELSGKCRQLRGYLKIECIKRKLTLQSSVFNFFFVIWLLNCAIPSQFVKTEEVDFRRDSKKDIRMILKKSIADHLLVKMPHSY